MKKWHMKRILLCLAGVQILLMLFFYRPFMFHIGDELIWSTSDDIYISACYARNLAEGNGLVWYPEALRVEGFSNPLWVLLLTVVHLLPFFNENMLGLYIIIINAGALVLLYRLFWIILNQSISDDKRINNCSNTKNELFSNTQKWFVVGIAISIPSLAYWAASGYSICLVSALALGGFVLAMREERTVGNSVVIGLLIGIAFWTRMDGILYFLGCFLLISFSGKNRIRSLSIQGSVSATMIAALFLLRWTYYKELLPNTYYLKLHGWALQDRIIAGVIQNWPIYLVVVFAWIAVALPSIRGRLKTATFPIIAAIATFTIAVMYSTYCGGDAWGRILGFDRFSTIGAVFLILAVCLGYSKLDIRKGRRVFIFIIAWIVLILPIVIKPNLKALKYSLSSSYTIMEESWIAYGKAFREVSRPGARIAIAPAGAIVYFSHRGGVDLLGKNDPLIARIDVNNPLEGVGHNKRDDLPMFRLHKPDFSRYPVPESFKHLYKHAQFNDHEFWVRFDSEYVHWDRLILMEK